MGHDGLPLNAVHQLMRKRSATFLKMRSSRSPLSRFGYQSLRAESGKEATLPSPPPLRTVRATFTAYRSSTDKPGSNPAGRELSFSTFTFLPTLSVITCYQLMQGRDSEIKPTSSFQRIPVYDTLQ